MPNEPVRFGVHVGQQQCTMAELRTVWQTAEALGFDWISGWDHFYPATLPLDDPCFEGLTCHAALAALTQRVRVGSLVYSSGFRHPAVMANAASTIDHISGGRLELGIGAGWHQAEYDGYGIPFETPGARLRRLRESVEIIRALWTEDAVDYDGEFYTLTSAYCSPKPVQRLPRIWVGASGEKVGLKLAGEVGDAWNLVFPSPEEFARKAEIVRSHSPRPDSMTMGVNLNYMPVPEHALQDALVARFATGADGVKPATLFGSPDQMTEHIQQYVTGGATWIILALRAPFDLPALERFATDVLPLCRQS